MDADRRGSVVGDRSLAALAPPAPVSAPTVPAQPPVDEKSTVNPVATDSHSFAFCWEIAADYSVYITPVLDLGNGVEVQRVNRDFHAFIQERYNANASAQCPAARDHAGADRDRQDQIDQLKRTTPKTRTLKFVDVEWKPAAATHSAAKAPTAIPSAPKPSALDAYQQAMAAQRPNGVAASQQVFCHADGAHSGGGGGQAQIYVSKVFAAAATAQAGVAFQTYLRGAHPDLTISTATCQTAPDADTLQGTRADYIANQKKIPTRAVVEVDWKGGQ